MSTEFVPRRRPTMKFNKTLLKVALLGTIPFFCNCQDEEEAMPTPQNGKIVLHYMAVQNSLGAEDTAGWSYANDDLQEIQEGCRYMAPGDTLVVLVDDKDAPRIYAYYRNCPSPLKLYTFDTDVNTSDPKSLKFFLTWAKQHFGNKIYGLGIGTHANGWIPSTNTHYYSTSKFSLGIDTGTGGNMYTDRDSTGQTGAQMNISDFAQAIAQSGVHPHYIFFDACLMQNIETAYELRNAADYIVASPMSISAYGANYTHLIKKGLFSDQVTDIAQTYYDDVTDPQQQIKYGNFGMIISVVNTTELENLATCTKEIVVPHFMNQQTFGLNNVLHYYYYNQFYYYTIPHYFDALNAMQTILSPEELVKWRQQLQRTVCYKQVSSQFLLGPYSTDYEDVDTASCGGISIFIPQTVYAQHESYNFNKQFRQTSWYKAAGWNETGW